MSAKKPNTSGETATISRLSMVRPDPLRDRDRGVWLSALHVGDECDGSGIGLAMAPATQAIMSALPPAKAGVGSAIDDTTRNLGGVLGIAVIGSIVASAYKTALAPVHITAHVAQLAPVQITAHVAQLARQSVGAAIQIAHQLPGPAGRDVATMAHGAFAHAADRGLLAAAIVTFAGLVIAACMGARRDALSRASPEPPPVQHAAPAGA